MKITMKEEKNMVKTGKAYEALSAEEKALISGFTPVEHAELKARYGKRLRHVTVQIDEDERYDYLVARPTKDVILAMASHRDDLNVANELLINTCVVAGDKEALEDAAVYTAVLTAVGELIQGQAAFISKA